MISIYTDDDRNLCEGVMSLVASQAAEDRYLDVAGARIAYRSFGAATGVPLVLLQRFRGTMDHWDPALLDILAQERPVIIFDNVGVGLSSGQAADSISGMAQTAAAFIDKLGLTQVDLLGWSMGGAVGQQVTLDRPQLVRRLILAGTGPGGVAEAPRAPDRVWQVVGKPVTEDADFLYLFFAEDGVGREAGLASLRRLDRRLVASQSAVGPESVKAQFTAVRTWSEGKGCALPRLGEVAIPVFVANGVNDIMVHAYNSYVLAQRLPDAQLTLYPKAGHGFLFQHHELFGRHVLEFLR